MRILVPNLGSTSLKYQLIETDGETVLARGKIDRIGGAESQVIAWEPGRPEESRSAHIPDHRTAIKVLIDHLAGLGGEGASHQGISAVGFKAVHGGPNYCGSFLIDDQLLAAMQEFVPVAPAHNPIYIQAMNIFRDLLPGVPMVAVFETGFHATIPDQASYYGVPYEWREKYGVRRYGFHGSSHRYIGQRVPQMLRRSAEGLRLVSCHLGGSSSICAIKDAKSIDISHGFSPQSGLEQSSRAGDLDSFAILEIMDREKLSPADMRRVLAKNGGLAGISGLSNDVRDLELAAAHGHERASTALAVFIYQIKKHVGAYAAAMGGLDAVAFAGGIGENSWRTRELVCSHMEFLGMQLDEEANRLASRADRIISFPGSPVTLLVVYTNEELMVVREAVKVLCTRQARL